ncbi:hypothetical protein FB451DRAFT_1294166 [Mycena latifolia]|nr:hypothetical protein FB451DRAFT_1294166 [Mycena latifolia]
MNSNPDFQSYQACLLRELRRLTLSWLLVLNDSIKIFTRCGLPAPHPDYPLPSGFVFRTDRKITETIEWIHEYGAEQIHHRYLVTFGFWGSHGAALSWGLSSGQSCDEDKFAAYRWLALGANVLARFDIPRAIIDDPAVAILPRLVLEGVIHSLTLGEQIKLKTHVDQNSIPAEWEDPHYFQEYWFHKTSNGHATRRVGLRLAQPCEAPGCGAYVQYPGLGRCPRHTLRPA